MTSAGALDRSQQSNAAATAAAAAAAAASASAAAAAGRKIFVPRDYSDGLALKFSTAFPSQLQGRLPEEAFTAVVTNINQILTAAERGSPGVYLESFFACLTGYLLYLCMDTHYEKSLKEVSKLVGEYNRNIFEPNRLHLVDPSDRGLRVLEIVVLND